MIKEISRSEIQKCVKVIRESFLTVANELSFNQTNAPRFTAFSINEERLYWQYDNENRKMFAYYIDNNIVGYYSLLFINNSECELNNLCVKPEYRYKKIGQQLLEHCYQYAQNSGIQKIKIGIVDENIKLRRWYENNGFKHIKSEKFDFLPFTCGYMERDLYK